MADLGGFDARKVDPSSNIEAIPAGKYTAVITDSEMRPNKAGTGEYLALTFQVIEGPFANRPLWARLNLRNPNPTAVEFARADLSAICRAVDVLEPGDSADLHNLPLIVHVRCKKREDTGDIVNEIRGYSAKSRPTAGTAGNMSTANNTPPWSRG